MMNQQRIGLLVVYLLVVSAVAAMAATPAGTRIQATGTAQYYSTSGSAMPTGTSNVVTTTVMQVAGISLTPTVNTKQGSAGSTVDFPLAAKNTGNGPDTFDLTASTQQGSTVTVYKDENGDGVHQPTETTVVTSTGLLPIGGTFNCIASATLPGSAVTDITTVTAKSRFDATKSAASTLTIQEKISSTYITSWLVNGYHPNTDRTTILSRDYLGGEAGVNPTEGGMSGGKPWVRMDSATNYVDLFKYYNSATFGAAYLFTYVYSPSPQTVNMWVGSDDGIKVWLDGSVVWTNDAFRAYVMDGDKTTVRLPGGWSRLLVKVSQATAAWGFSVKFCDAQGNAVPGMEYDIAPITLPNDDPPTISNVRVTPSSNSALVEWDTDMPSDSLVDCWNIYNVYYTRADWTLVTHHSITVTGLTPVTAYSFAVTSTSAQGMMNFAEGTFQTTAAPPPISGGAYNKTWLINGYYLNSNQSTRLSADYLGGEAGVNPKEGSVSAGKTWFKLTANSEFVDFRKYVGAVNYCAGYAFAYVYSPSIQTANMWMGSNDGIKVWLNGSVVWTNDASRSFTVDKDKTTVTLPSGWSRLLVKVSQNTGSWGFSLKFCDSAGNALPGVAYALTTPGGADTTAPVISNIKITPSSTSAVVEWDTNEAATTLADYGSTSSLGTDYSDDSLTTHHTATLPDLVSSTTYYIRIGSADSSGNSAWQGTYDFQTSALTSPSSPYIMSWLVNGIYKNSRSVRMSTDYLGNEGAVTPREGTVSGGNTWFRLDSNREYIDLKTPFNSPKGCAGYAFVYVYSSVAQSANLWMGSDDGIKVWLNGSLIWNNDIYRSMKLDVDHTTVNLAAGWNRVLVKVTQADQGWGFSFRLCDSAGNALPGVATSLAP